MRKGRHIGPRVDRGVDTVELRQVTSIGKDVDAIDASLVDVGVAYFGAYIRKRSIIIRAS